MHTQSKEMEWRFFGLGFEGLIAVRLWLGEGDSMGWGFDGQTCAVYEVRLAKRLVE
ncbi:hypothetical protein COCOBI_pt-1130 (chloroplast) [Coccomyxa sp. Obi]|nr:hypothetical protein COCOBI_pt-1130 [Coccomyxa sp. Obi]